MLASGDRELRRLASSIWSARYLENKIIAQKQINLLKFNVVNVTVLVVFNENILSLSSWWY